MAFALRAIPSLENETKKRKKKKWKKEKKIKRDEKKRNQTLRIDVRIIEDTEEKFFNRNPRIDCRLFAFSAVRVVLREPPSSSTETSVILRRTILRNVERVRVLLAERSTNEKNRDDSVRRNLERVRKEDTKSATFLRRVPSSSGLRFPNAELVFFVADTRGKYLRTLSVQSRAKIRNAEHLP